MYATAFHVPSSPPQLENSPSIHKDKKTVTRSTQLAEQVAAFQKNISNAKSN